MWQRHHWRLAAEGHALDADVAQAGCALACPYSSADEFEAAVIRARRAAGVYGPKRRRRQLAAGAAGAGALLALLIWLIWLA
jgi:hypothetical protein